MLFLKGSGWSAGSIHRPRESGAGLGSTYEADIGRKWRGGSKRKAGLVSGDKGWILEKRGAREIAKWLR
jgi:hypothetical protein